MKRLTPKAVEEQIARTLGNLAAVARNFGVSRASVWQYVQKRPELVAALKDARESLVDNAESALAVAVTKGEGWAVCFALKCLGKERGYVERQEVTGRDGGPVTMRVEEIVVGGNQSPVPVAPGPEAVPG